MKSKVDKYQAEIKCRQCGEIFVDGRSHGRIYCSRECYSLSLKKYKQDYVRPCSHKNKVKKRCLGVKCRGKKDFWSEGSHQRICPICKEAAKRNNEDSYNIQ